MRSPTFEKPPLPFFFWAYFDVLSLPLLACISHFAVLASLRPLGRGDWGLGGGGGGSLFHFPFSVPHFPMWGPIFGRFVETVKTECLENSMLLPIFRASGFRLQASFCENFILNLMNGCLPLPTYASPELLHHPRAPVVLLNPRHSRRTVAALPRIVEL